MHCSILKGCSLAAYLFVLIVDALVYLLEVSHIFGHIHGIVILDGFEGGYIATLPMTLLVKA